MLALTHHHRFIPEGMFKMVDKVANPITYVSSGAAVVLGTLTTQEMAAVVGVGIAGCAFFTNVLFKFLTYRLEVKRLKMEQVQRERA